AICKQPPEVDVDAAPLAAALTAAGVDFELLAWDDPAVDWAQPVPTILRSTWNYALDLEAFLAWIDRVSDAAPLWNPPEVVHANVRKRDLLQLAARGVPVIPTTLVEKGRTIPLPDERLVIKPEVGTGSLGTRVFEPGDPAAAAHLAPLTRTGAALVQPRVMELELVEPSLFFRRQPGAAERYVAGVLRRLEQLRA